MIPLGNYLPDLPAQGGHCTTANNCVPAVGYYTPFYAAAQYTTAGAEEVLGADGFKSLTGTSYTFAGTATYLYRVVAGALSNVSKSGNYSTSAGRWEFAQFGDRVIAVNGQAKPQSFVMGTSTLFADLTADDVVAKTVGIVRGFVFLGYMTESGVEYRNRVRWSALEDPTDFTASVTTQSDFQDLFGESEIGSVQRIIGGENAIIFCERGVFVGTYVGGSVIFTFDQIGNNIGTLAPMSVVSHGGMVFFLGNNGFYQFAGGTLNPIGEGKVDDTFFAELYTAEIGNIVATIDPDRNLYIVAYPTATGALQKLLIYNWVSQRWSTAEPGDLEYIFNAYDSGVDTLMAADSTHKLVTFTGSALAATIETTESQLNPGGKALIKNITPMVEGSGSTITAKVGYRNTPQETVSYTSASTANTEGECNLFNAARYQRIQLGISGGFTKAYGVDLEVVRAGRY